MFNRSRLPLHTSPRLRPRLAGVRLMIGIIGSISSMSLHGDPLREFNGCVLLPTEWADGDSFLVRFPSGEEHTIRLYGADCLEWHVTDASDERRLREQRRYFGISEAESSPRASIDLAKDFGRLAAEELGRALTRPFTVHTAFADARGDGRFKRVYGFVITADGQDLASLLVKKGLARAHGVYRETPDGSPRDDYRGQLADLELQAAKRGLGIWSRTDWDNLPGQRGEQRKEDAETAIAIGKDPLGDDIKLNPNTAARDDLMRLPGIGEALANRIIEGRPYKRLSDLLAVNGIGPATLKAIQPHLHIDPP